MRLWVDDERPAPEGWSLAETCPLACHLIRTGVVDELSLDHDLGDTLTGYDVAAWVEAQAALGRWSWVPARIVCHSANPTGKARIDACIASIERMREAGRDG